MQSEKISSAQLRADLSQFTGTETWYRHSLQKSFLYTEGVQYFAEHAGCYWFLDIIATEIFQLQKQWPFLVIELDVVGTKAQIRTTDGNENQVWTRSVSFTDCPEGRFKFYLVDNICLLPSEY